MLHAPRIHTVPEWGGLIVPNGTLMTRVPAGILVHHTAGGNARPGPTPAAEAARAFQLARDIQLDHMRRNGWRDSGHHFLISRGGLILEGRCGTLAAARLGKVLLGAHSGNNRVNATYWGTEVEGTYTDTLPTAHQWEAMLALFTWLSVVGNTQSQAINGHREFRATECPGEELYRELPRLRALVKERKEASM